MPLYVGGDTSDRAIGGGPDTGGDAWLVKFGTAIPQG